MSLKRAVLNIQGIRQLLSRGSAPHAVRSLCSTAPEGFPDSADIVVIGGGSVGCSTLYHLAKLGANNSILIEKDKLTSGTTWHTAGMLWRLRPNDVDIALTDVTRTLNRKTLPEETGQSTGWIENGGLFIASTKERLDEYKRLMSLGKAFGIESFVLSPAETKDLYPTMNVDDVYGSLYSPGDGLVDPTGWCNSLTRVAKEHGCKVFEGVAAIDILSEVDPVFGHRKVTGVKTQHGIVKTNAVALCAGVWSPKLGAKLNINIPTIAMKHAYVITDKIEGVQGMPNVRDHDSSVYLRLQGDALGVGGYQPNPHMWEDVVDDFSFGLFDLDWDSYGSIFQAAINRVPALEHVGVKSEVCGPMSFTADHRPMMGEPPGWRGLFLSCGHDIAMMMGGGLGEQTAKWMLKGRPDFHMYAWDVCRFPAAQAGNYKWLKERAHECHVTMYKTVVPHDEFLGGRNLRFSPFHNKVYEAGAVWEERHGWERPGWFAKDGKLSVVLDYDWYGAYEGTQKHPNYIYRDHVQDDATFDWPKHQAVISEECMACRNDVVVFDMTYFGKFFLTGPDAQAAANWLFTNNVAQPPGTTVYTCMLNTYGGIEADLTVSTLAQGEGSPIDPVLKDDEKGFYIAVGGGVAEHCWRHLSTEIANKGFNVNFWNDTEASGILSVQGPKSRAVMRELFPDFDFSNEAFPFGTNKMLVDPSGKYRCRALRVSFVGELGWEMHIPTEHCVPLYDLLFNAGRKHGLIDAGFRAMDSLSVEKGYRLWNGDIRLSDTPLEAAMLYTCKLKTDTPFLGRKALEERRANKIRERIVCITIDKQVPLWGLEALFRDGIPVGFVRRAEYAHVLQKPIGYAFVSKPDKGVVSTDWIKSGTYTIERMGEVIPAQVYLKSPFDPDHKRLQGIYETAKEKLTHTAHP